MDLGLLQGVADSSDGSSLNWGFSPAVMQSNISDWLPFLLIWIVTVNVAREVIQEAVVSF